MERTKERTSKLCCAGRCSLVFSFFLCFSTKTKHFNSFSSILHVSLNIAKKHRATLLCASKKEKHNIFEQVVRGMEAVGRWPKAKIQRFRAGCPSFYSFCCSTRWFLCVECANFLTSVFFLLLPLQKFIFNIDEALYVFQIYSWISSPAQPASSWITGDSRTLVILERKFLFSVYIFFVYAWKYRHGTNGTEYAIGEMWTNLLAVPTFVVVIIPYEEEARTVTFLSRGAFVMFFFYIWTFHREKTVPRELWNKLMKKIYMWNEMESSREVEN